MHLQNKKSSFLGCSIFAVFLTSIAASGVSESEVLGNTTLQSKIEAIEEKINAVSEASGAHEFYKIHDDVVALTHSMTENAVPESLRRKTLFGLLLKGMDKMDRLMDPDFDPSDYPYYLNIALPEGASGRSGCDPSSIKDPVLRREYEQTIATNIENAELCNIQSSLTSQIDSWAVLAKVTLKNWEASSPGILGEAEDLIDKLISNPARRAQLRESISGVQETGGQKRLPVEEELSSSPSMSGLGSMGHDLKASVKGVASTSEVSSIPSATLPCHLVAQELEAQTNTLSTEALSSGLTSKASNFWKLVILTLGLGILVVIVFFTPRMRQ